MVTAIDKFIKSIMVFDILGQFLKKYMHFFLLFKIFSVQGNNDLWIEKSFSPEPEGQETTLFVL